MLHGSPGCGKSQIIADIAEELNLQMIDVRLAQMDSTDLNNI
jgi:MoxR-like ATPase